MKIEIMKYLTDKSSLPPADTDKKYCKKELKKIKEELFSLQNKFYADGRYGLLIILQGVDTSGKDGTIRHAFTSMNPTGVHVTSFKEPACQELDHDFLWRIYPHIPGKRMIGVFNRSYYEDILVPSVNKTLSKEDIQHRCRLINELEDHLIRNDIHILKFFLHISADEQKERIEERKNKPHKKWKYEIADDKAPKEWNNYMKSYNMLVGNCNQHPWHIIPGGKRWYRNFAVAKVLKNHLDSLHLKFP